MKVGAVVDIYLTQNEDGYEVMETCAICRRCDLETTSYGDSEASVRRCLVLLREECPKGEANFYVEVFSYESAESPQ